MAQIRNNLPSDKAEILSFCKDTFSWGDYIHEVWDSWEKDGHLLILEKDNNAIGMCHGVTYQNENMIWLEGIRVKQGHRKKGYATNLIRHFEKIAKNSGISHLNMLIESENTSSLNLVKKLNYSIISVWNYYSISSKKTNCDKIKFEPIKISDLIDFANIRFVESWRWIPLIESNFDSLNLQGYILCLKKHGKVESLGIISESESFDDTMILTIVFGISDQINQIISYTQNLAVEKKYSKIRELAKEELVIAHAGKKYPFSLVEKIL